MRLGRRGLLGLAAIGLSGVFAWRGWAWVETRPLRQAEAAYRRFDWGVAYAAAEAYRRTNPTSQAAALLAMRSLAQMGRCDAALRLSTQIANPELDDLRLIASCLIAQGTRGGSRPALKRAAELYRRIGLRDPTDSKALQSLVVLLIQLDEQAEAIETAKKLATNGSHARSAHAMLGAIYQGQGNHALACEHLLQVLALDPQFNQGPESPETLRRMLARSLLQLGRGAEAEPHLKRLLQTESSPEVLWLLGHARQQQGDAEGAVAHWQDAIERDADYLPALKDLGELELARHRPGAALKWLECAARLAAKDASVRYQLGLASQQLGRTDEAARRFQESQRLGTDPSN